MSTVEDDTFIVSTMNSEYMRFVSDLRIVDKTGTLVDFSLNPIQRQFLTQDYAPKCVILKARQQGFSTLINAMLTMDFLTKPHTYNMVIADDQEHAEGLLERVKKMIESWQKKHGLESAISFSTDTKYHLRFEEMDCDYVVETAGSKGAGRSKTISNLHLSEAAFFGSLSTILAGAGQAVSPTGRTLIETTANGFNEFKSFWNDSKLGLTGYTPLFYKASAFYSPEFLATKKAELRDIFPQEYPETDTEAFIASGNRYFDTGSLTQYLSEVDHGSV